MNQQQTITLFKTQLHHLQKYIANGYQMVSTTKDSITLSMLQQKNTCSIGVGAIIKRNNSEFLLVQEANGPVRGRWAFPAGLLKPQETIQEGIIREIQEELGVNSKYQEILFFGQQANSRWGKQDFYYGCSVELLSTEFKLCQKELLQYQWLDINKIRQLELTQITRIGLDFII